MKTNRHSSGATLVELMTVLAILVLSLSLVAPSISEYLEDRKIRNVAESLFYGMQVARLRAVQTNIQTQFAWTGMGWTVSQLNMDAQPPIPITPALETFAWGGGGGVNNWSSVSTVAVRDTVPQTIETSAIVTFDGMGKVVLPINPSNGNPPPSWFNASGRTGSRAFRVLVNAGGGLRVCDPQLPQSDPKGC